VEAFTNMRFEPAGRTDDPELRLASSIMDYLFRRLALVYMTYDERAELGIYSVNERLQPTLPGIEESVTPSVQGVEIPADPKSVPSASELAASELAASEVVLQEKTRANSQTLSGPARSNPVATSDAPMCMQCGVAMIRAGSCHACPSCGSTSGCS
jgi:ribonucleoside-diphosphate reductase alpha chain